MNGVTKGIRAVRTWQRALFPGDGVPVVLQRKEHVKSYIEIYSGRWYSDDGSSSVAQAREKREFRSQLSHLRKEWARDIAKREADASKKEEEMRMERERQKVEARERQVKAAERKLAGAESQREEEKRRIEAKYERRLANLKREAKRREIVAAVREER